MDVTRNFGMETFQRVAAVEAKAFIVWVKGPGQCGAVSCCDGGEDRCPLGVEGRAKCSAWKLGTRWQSRFAGVRGLRCEKSLRHLVPSRVLIWTFRDSACEPDRIGLAETELLPCLTAMYGMVPEYL